MTKPTYDKIKFWVASAALGVSVMMNGYFLAKAGNKIDELVDKTATNTAEISNLKKEFNDVKKFNQDIVMPHVFSDDTRVKINSSDNLQE